MILLFNGLTSLPLIICELNGIGIFICKKIFKIKNNKKNFNISILKNLKDELVAIKLNPIQNLKKENYVF